MTHAKYRGIESWKAMDVFLCECVKVFARQSNCDFRRDSPPLSVSQNADS